MPDNATGDGDLGRRYAAPLGIAPMGGPALVWPGADRFMAQAAQQQMQGGRPPMDQRGQGGAPGPRPSRSGAPPRIGAMPAGPRLATAPPGAIRPDAMPAAGAVPFPRRY